MKILLTDNASILEFLYRKTSGEDVELVMKMADADAVVGTSIRSNFYGKTLIVNSLKSESLESIIRLSKVNEVVSRLPLGDIGVEYKLDPYELIKLEEFKISHIRNKPVSELSIRDFIMTKYKGTFQMEGASSYLGTKYKSSPTLVGLLKHQIEG
jgi:hypothetical protein